MLVPFMLLASIYLSYVDLFPHYTGTQELKLASIKVSENVINGQIANLNRQLKLGDLQYPAITYLVTRKHSVRSIKFPLNQLHGLACYILFS